jgi:hypothetical protein
MKTRIVSPSTLLLLCSLGMSAHPAEAASIYEPYAFTTFAGVAGSAGSTDGAGNQARFYKPYHLALDSLGNLYVTDFYNFTVRKITPGGFVSTLAGLAGVQGGTDGTGSEARFFGPSGVAVDSSGNVYVTDGDAVRKITPSGVVTTFAGLTGVSGYVDGTRSEARFTQAIGLAMDASGNIYVADAGNQIIRQVTSAGVVTTLGGLPRVPGYADGTGNQVRFNYPLSVAISSSGDLYAGDVSPTVRKITPAKVVTTLAGLAGVYSSNDGIGTEATFHSPIGIAADSPGNIYVADLDGFVVRKITPNGVVTTLGGMHGEAGSVDGTGSKARFRAPSGVVVDRAGTVYVADRDNNTIRKGVRAASLGPHAARATARAVNGFLVEITIMDGGAGYTEAPNVTIVGGEGTGASAVATIANGMVTSIKVLDAGSGYTGQPLVVIDSPPFAPRLSVEVSRVAVKLKVSVGKKYLLESSQDLKVWTPAEDIFVAEDENLTREFVVAEQGRFFRITQMP